MHEPNSSNSKQKRPPAWRNRIASLKALRFKSHDLMLKSTETYLAVWKPLIFARFQPWCLLNHVLRTGKTRQPQSSRHGGLDVLIDLRRVIPRADAWLQHGPLSLGEKLPPLKQWGGSSKVVKDIGISPQKWFSYHYLPKDVHPHENRYSPAKRA